MIVYLVLPWQLGGYSESKNPPAPFLCSVFLLRILVFTDDAGSGYNDSNAFALPSKSEAVLRKNRKNDLEPVGKILSKRRRKHLEKIVEKKAKKENRAELLQRLEINQVSEDYLEKMTSLSKVSMYCTLIALSKNLTMSSMHF